MDSLIVDFDDDKYPQVILRVRLCILLRMRIFYFNYTYKIWTGSPIELGMTVTMDPR